VVCKQMRAGAKVAKRWGQSKRKMAGSELGKAGAVEFAFPAAFQLNLALRYGIPLAG